MNIDIEIFDKESIKDKKPKDGVIMVLPAIESTQLCVVGEFYPNVYYMRFWLN